MHTHLPIISSAGLFCSQDKFSDRKKYPEEAITRLRTVTDYELELFTQDGGVSHINGGSFPITKGSLLIAVPGDKRQSTLHFSALFLHFSTSDTAIQELLSSIRGFHADMGYAKYEPILSDICETVLSFEPDSDVLAAAKLISFLCEIKKDCLTNSTDALISDHRSVISSAIEYMKQSYMEPLTVDNIAAHCNLSSSYFYKCFLSTVHTTPNQYLLTLRLSAAKALLVTTAMPISEIAAKCGFNSQAYFSDCFRRHFAQSPSQFRSSYVHPDSSN